MDDYKDIILKAICKGIDDQGFETSTEVKETKMLAKVRTVTRSEFYLAQKEGIDVQTLLIVNKTDYLVAHLLDSDGKRHKPTIAVVDGIEHQILKFYWTTGKVGGRNLKDNEVELTLKEAE